MCTEPEKTENETKIDRLIAAIEGLTALLAAQRPAAANHAHAAGANRANPFA